MVEYRNEGNFDVEVADGYIVACVAITSLVAFSIFVLLLLHNFYWKRQYHKSKDKIKGDFKFDHKTWYNDSCDKYYFNEV